MHVAYVGYSKLAASGVVNSSGKALALFGISIKSTTDGSGTVTLYDGTSTSGTELWALKGQQSEWKDFPFDTGRTFPSGLYLDFDSNVLAAVAWYQTLT